MSDSTVSTRSTPTPTPRTDRAILRGWAIAVVGWGVAVGALSLVGGLSRLPLMVLPALVAASTVVPLAVVLTSPRRRRLVAELDLAALTWFNVWRVPAAVAFFAVGAAGLLPARFVTNAAWGDLIAGVLAPVVVLAGRRLGGRRRRAVYLGYHVFSFADFVVAVGTGFTFTLLGDPLMRTLLDTPMALIPLWGVPITGAISLLALHRLIAGHRPAPPSEREPC